MAHWVSLASALLAVAGCDFPGKPDAADRPVVPADVLSFETLYRQNCAGCHGADGKLGPAPPLNDPIFLAIVPDSVLMSTIADGRHGTPMPAFARKANGALTDAQVLVLAAGLKQHWKSTTTPAPELPPYSLASTGRTAARGDQQRGAAVFARACATCHGKDGLGLAKDGVVRDVINDANFLALISDQALRRIIITGRPDLGMPTFAEKTGRADDFQPLTSDEIDDVVALLASWRAGAGSVAQQE